MNHFSSRGVSRFTFIVSAALAQCVLGCGSDDHPPTVGSPTGNVGSIVVGEGGATSFGTGGAGTTAGVGGDSNGTGGDSVVVGSGGAPLGTAGAAFGTSDPFASAGSAFAPSSGGSF